MLSGDETRLFCLLLLNAAVLWSAWRFSRRAEPDSLPDSLNAAGDALLLFYLVQYVSVCLPGLIGGLNAWSMAITALLFCAVMWFAAQRFNPPDTRPTAAEISRRDRIVAAGAGLFVMGYIAALIWDQRRLPVLSNDALTYHLPAAVQWLQTGKLGLYEAWFYNPANSYSPLAGSAFIAWLIAPLGNDAIARFVGAGPLIMLLVAMLNLCRRLGASVGVATLIAACCVLARPFVSQTILAKDDLFVAAFFVLLIDALTRERLQTRFGPWRAGIALGLLLATKYTALLSLPIVLLMLSRGWNWRRAAIVLSCAIVLAGPWYLRNLILTGNPLYPSRMAVGSLTLLPGMLQVQRSRLLGSATGVWSVFTGGYYGVPVLLAVVLLIGLAASMLIARGGWRDPLRRTCLIGPIMGIALFVAISPYGEMRFAYPSVALLFAAATIALIRLPWAAQASAAAVVMLVAARTAFPTNLTAPFIITGVVLGGIGTIAAALPLKRRFIQSAAGAMALALLLAVYVYWDAYVWTCEQDSGTAWSFPPPNAYGSVAGPWVYVRNEVPKGATIAYANTYFTYPLMGYRFDHRVVYVSTRADCARFIDMPAIAERVTGEEIVRRIVALLREKPDRKIWLRRLRESGADHLVVSKVDPAEPSKRVTPAELQFTAQDPSLFERVFDSPDGTVLRIRR